MKKELKYILGAHLVLILYLVYCAFDLITLLHDDSFADALLNVELNPSDGTLDKQTMIPKIIHQTYKTHEIPEIWRPGQQACLDLHPDYTYMMWTDETSRQFIEEEYPWFLETWDAYPYPIQRADVIRYFALAHYGGVYIDLDDGCERRLEPLLTVSAFVRKTIPTGISNDVMGSVPNHPFFLKVIDSLKAYQKNWLVPYITIMYTTGPLFLSVIWKQYKRWGVPEFGKVRILMPEDYKTRNYSFFAIAPGSSWHMDDAKFIKGLANHIVAAVFGGFMIAGFIFFLEYLFYSYVSSNHFKKMTKRVTNTMFGFICRVFKLEENLPQSCSSKFKENPEATGLFKLIKYKWNTNIKRRPRKDSNLPLEFDLLEKIDYEKSQQPAEYESGSGDDEYEETSYVYNKINDNIV